MKPDIVKAFLERNGLEMILRAHECVIDGFERFADGRLITVFSATNYCGTFVMFIETFIYFDICIHIIGM